MAHDPCRKDAATWGRQRHLRVTDACHNVSVGHHMVRRKDKPRSFLLATAGWRDA